MTLLEFYNEDGDTLFNILTMYVEEVLMKEYDIVG